MCNSYVFLTNRNKIIFVTVSAYQGLFNMEYSFPEEIYDSNKLIVMTSEAPPPIPVKKKRRNTAGVSNY